MSDIKYPDVDFERVALLFGIIAQQPGVAPQYTHFGAAAMAELKAMHQELADYAKEEAERLRAEATQAPQRSLQAAPPAGAVQPSTDMEEYRRANPLPEGKIYAIGPKGEMLIVDAPPTQVDPEDKNKDGAADVMADQVRKDADNDLDNDGETEEEEEEMGAAHNAPQPKRRV